MIIKKQKSILKILIAFIFTFVVLAGYNIDIQNTKVCYKVSAKELLTAKSRISSGGFRSSGFSSKPKSSISSGFGSGKFKDSGTSGSSKGYNSGSFKSSKDASSNGYGSGKFKESTPKVDTTPKVDNSNNKKGGSSVYPVPHRGYLPFGFNFFGGYFMMKFIIAAVLITVVVIGGFIIYKNLMNRRK